VQSIRGSITTLVSLITCLLLRERDDRARRVRHGASFRRARGTLFRHASRSKALSVRAIVIAVIFTPLLGLLVTKPARAQRPHARRLPTPRRAVPIAAIALPAQEKHLTAAALGARYKAK
jgi:hypothetical protein